MATLEQLKRRRSILKARDEARRDMKKIGLERKKLKKEITELKNPRTTAFRKNLKHGLVHGGKGTLQFLDYITRPVPIKKRTSVKRSIKSYAKRRRRKR